MNEHEAFEKAVLDEYEPRWRAQGYQVLRHPRKEDIPGFLRNYRPDALAVGPMPNLVVEILRKGHPASQTRIRQLREFLSGHPDWRLEVLYSGKPVDEVAPVSADAMEGALRSVRALARHDPQAGLLMSWATLEALVRRLEPQKATGAQTPGRVVELLAGSGYVVPSVAEQLRKAAAARNRLAHGDLTVQPTSDEVQALAGMIEELIGVLRERDSGADA